MDKDTLLLRQVHPSFIQGTEISSLVFTSQVFVPTVKDENKLSTYSGEKFSPSESFDHYKELEFESAGVVGVTNNECESQELPVIEDNIPFDGHCSIDYSGLGGNGIKKKAKKLKQFAADRGWLYRE